MWVVASMLCSVRHNLAQHTERAASAEAFLALAIPRAADTERRCGASFRSCTWLCMRQWMAMVWASCGGQEGRRLACAA